MNEDARLYLTASAPFLPQVHWGSETRRCCRTPDGDEGFHRLAEGEVFLSDGERDFCLQCAVALGFAGRTRPMLGSGLAES